MVDSGRLRGRAGRLAAFGIGLAAGGALLATFGFIGLWMQGFFAGNDFSAIWAGPRILATGGDPYDPTTFRRAAEALGTLAPATDVYIYPGWVAVVLTPLGALDLGTANVVWLALGLLVATTGLFVLLEALPVHLPLVHTLLAFALVGSESGIVAFYSGQSDFLIVGGLALMAGWLWTGRLVPAGIAASVMLIKPQLFALAIPALVGLALARRERRFVYALAAAGLALAALSTLVVPQWWSAWLTHVPATRAADVRAATLPNALRDIFGTAGLVAAYVLLAASVAAAFAFGRSRVAVPVWLAVSMSVAPYLFVYDHVVAVVPLAMAAAVNGERDRRAAIAVAGLGVLILAVAATVLHALPGVEHRTLSYNGLAQFALTTLIIASLWRFRKESIAESVA